VVFLPVSKNHVDVITFISPIAEAKACLQFEFDASIFNSRYSLMRLQV